MSNQLAEALRLIVSGKDPRQDRVIAAEALAAHEAAKPEPVAFVPADDIAPFLTYGGSFLANDHPRDDSDVPLYAAPVAVASPLSDEQLDRLEDGCWDGPGLGARFDKRKFARAIEQAHGIKEKP